MNKKIWIAGFVLLLASAFAFFPAQAEEKPQAPVFSVPGGFYDDAVDLEITSPDGYDIRYTLDATSSVTMDTVFIYERPIQIANTDQDENKISAIRDITLDWYWPQQEPVPKATVVRAVCVSPDGQFSDELIETYFIGRTESYYQKMGTISLVTDPSNLFGAANGIFVIGNRFEEWKKSALYEEYEHPSDPRYPTNYNQRGREWERPANIQVFENGQSMLNQGIGIRVKGNFSRGNAQKSLTLYARKEYGKGKMKYDFFDGRCLDMNGEPITAFDRVCLRNGGNDYAGVRFRDDLNQELMGQTHLGVQTKAPYIVYINGEFWGMYTMQEVLDEHYLASHYGVDKNNVTIIKCGELDEGDERIFSLYEAFHAWCLTADLSDPENYAKVDETIDTDGLTDLFVGESYVNNYDFAILINNWMIWRVNEPDGNPYGDGKWHFLVYDTEYSLELYDQIQTAVDYDYFDHLNIDEEEGLPIILFNLVMDNEDFCERFYNRYCELADTVYAYDNVLPIIERLAEQQQEACMDTMKRFGVTWNEYNGEVWKIKEFFRQRREYILESLESFCE